MNKKEKRAAYQREYHKSTKWIAYSKRIRQTEKYKAARRAYMKKYSASRRGKERKKEYLQTHKEQFRILRKKWYQRNKDKVLYNSVLLRSKKISAKVLEFNLKVPETHVLKSCRHIYGTVKTIEFIKMYNRIMRTIIQEYEKKRKI
jgi:hypothetical protein